MKISILFGSESDHLTYEPLKNALAKDHQVDLKIISAHRDPVLLEKYLSETDYDAVVAGAGIAAHLPGVIASKTPKLVFGKPVATQFGGMDALLSILQMPYRVPVVTASPTESADLVNFIRVWEKQKKENFNRANLVVEPKLMNYEYVDLEIKRALELAKTMELETAVNMQKDLTELPADCMNIILVGQKKDIRPGVFCLHVPVLNQHDKTNPSKVMEIYDWVTTGGLWLGVNNTRNALITTKKLSKYGGLL